MANEFSDILVRVDDLEFRCFGEYEWEDGRIEGVTITGAYLEPDALSRDLAQYLEQDVVSIMEDQIADKLATTVGAGDEGDGDD